MRDAIIGSITNYTIEQIKPWVESLNLSGFTVIVLWFVIILITSV
jgi:hypothetical protein